MNKAFRNFLALVALVAALSVIAACAPAAQPTSTPPTSAPAATNAPAPTTAPSAGRAIKIGYVSPQTGPLAPFGEADKYVLDQMQKQFANGITIAGVSHPVQIIVKDTQSDPNRAAQVAADLITNDKVDLILVESTPETTNPVSDQCELNQVPCISTVAPWQAWFIGRGGEPGKTEFKWTYHFFWGLEDIIAVFNDLWNQVPTDKVVGGLWPNDGDGNVWSNPEVGFPPVLTKNGYTIVDPGRYQNLKDDFSAEIGQFKAKNVEIVTGVVIPPDLGTIVTQMSQQGFHPKMVTVGKAALFPSTVESITSGLGDGLTSEIWWTPSHPFKSSLTGQSAKELADAFEQDTGKQWTQPLGFTHALFEVAADALKRTANLDDKQAIITAIKATKLDTIVGTVDWSAGPVPNVAKTPLVGGQWVKGAKYPFDLVITSNTLAPNIPTGGKTKVMPWAQ
jgi:branched-chain amino acid transport system substrate-binding protein